MRFWRERRSRTAFETLMLPHLDAAYSLARWLLRRADAADDAVQESYIRALKAFDAYEGGDARAWLLAIVRNVCFTALRRQATHDNVIMLGEAWERAEMFVASGEPAPDRALEQRQDSDRLRQAIAALPPEFREVLVLREIEEMSYRDIAKVVGIPAGTVMSRLARARDRLAEALGAKASPEARHRR